MRRSIVALLTLALSTTVSLADPVLVIEHRYTPGDPSTFQDFPTPLTLEPVEFDHVDISHDPDGIASAACTDSEVDCTVLTFASGGTYVLRAAIEIKYHPRGANRGDTKTLDAMVNGDPWSLRALGQSVTPSLWGSTQVGGLPVVLELQPGDTVEIVFVWAADPGQTTVDTLYGLNASIVVEEVAPTVAQKDRPGG